MFESTFIDAEQFGNAEIIIVEVVPLVDVIVTEEPKLVAVEGTLMAGKVVQSENAFAAIVFIAVDIPNEVSEEHL